MGEAGTWYQRHAVKLDLLNTVIFKLIAFYRLLGPNVVASEGDVWRRHRRVTAPAFNHSAYENVWNVTAGVYSQICDKEGWNDSNVVNVKNMNKLTHQVRNKF